ncbi:MAG: tetratricopeptide repeat protein [bacterium]
MKRRAVEPRPRSGDAALPPPAGAPVRSVRIATLALVALVLLVFARTVGFALTTWDDDVNVTRNPLLSPPLAAHVAAIWRAPYAGLYVPVTYTVFALESAASRLLGGADAAPDARIFHLGNLILHVACVLLVFRLLRTWVRDETAAFLGAALFAVHPVQVETVAWVTETKGLLATVFALAALDLWTGAPAAASGGIDARAPLRRRAIATVFYVLAILAKPAAVVVPLVAFAADVGVHRRSPRASALRLLPWLVLAGAAIVLTKAQQPDRLAGAAATLAARPLVALDALAFYTGKLVWPARLAIDYGRTPARALASGAIYWTWLAPAAVVAALLRARSRHLTTAAAIVAAWLGPVLGLVPFAQQYTSTVADRYLYPAMLGVALAVASALAARRNVPLRIGAAALVAILAAASFAQSSRWRTSDALYRQALSVNPKSAAAHSNLASLLLADGRVEEALSHFDGALSSNPGYVPALVGKGNALVAAGRLPEAIPALEEAVRLAPSFAEAHAHLAAALASAGRDDEAVQHLETARRLRPDDPDVNCNLGAYFLSRGDVDRAEQNLRRAVAADPRFAEAHYQLGTCLWTRGELDGALAQYRTAIRLDPGHFEALRDTGKLLFNRGDRKAAADLWRRAAQLRPDDEEVRRCLAQLEAGS